MIETRDRPFSPALFSFLRELRENNDRDWFAANKDRYVEHVQEPAMEFIAAFAPHLHAISRNFRADAKPVGGSLFRIYRDVRFSRDKSPYKTAVGIQFRHRSAGDAHAPGFYLHLEPGEVWVGAGIWHPDGASLAELRGAVAADPRGWRRAAHGKPFAERFTLTGDSLKRPPAGYPPDHPLIEDLKRKDFVGSAPLSEREVTALGFAERYAEVCRDAAAFVRFLCRAVGKPF